ncbi:SGNH/GDSL hydrolase family protein [Lacticaseibacillus pabuli]|uniref:SGNH/GDSL hydrolase family protein n=1 Tax=Lacticaseibacillus pabuli TaxID=3025672 RepID=A0ABY7WSH1_9LACO|nr:SGNH/GDSL hydrolase family protein [Lacticaseibacillus sp. KACC 23028]WDF83130.1 SGNH/GDSL hydrolase family protein [Lacticaseibacillus sp. KACC 23028]
MKHPLIKTTAVLGAGAAAYRFIPRPLKALVIGNAPQYAPERLILNTDSPLYGKRIGFLGSSITYGAAAGGKSFVEDLVAQDGVIATKSAISGTTLAGSTPKTYVSRIVTDFDNSQPLDAFVCQLSTNDSRQGLAMGQISETNHYDVQTTIGAMEFICQYVADNFGCPMVFYTCVRKSDSDYEELIRQLYALQTKWNCSVIDLWGDPVLKHRTALSPNSMMDDAHPTRLGYETMWLPIFERDLAEVLAGKR